MLPHRGLFVLARDTSAINALLITMGSLIRVVQVISRARKVMGPPTSKNASKGKNFAFLTFPLPPSIPTPSAVADCLSLFALFRVGAGAAAAGCLLSRFVYCMELSVTSNRTAAGFVSNIFMTVGYAILALLAYLMRDWRHLMLAVSVPGVLLLLFWW